MDHGRTRPLIGVLLGLLPLRSASAQWQPASGGGFGLGCFIVLAIVVVVF